MDKAIVLMSTYNGERYLNEQIESIMSQTYPDLELYIRDDGSIDNTLDILKKWDTNSRVHIIEGENKGYPACFWELLKMDISGDYFFFADQDDFWLDNKVEMAIRKMKKYKNTALCYYSAYNICDESLNIVSISSKLSGRIRLENVLFEVPGLEFTMAINKRGREELLKNLPMKSSGRGTWIAMFFAGCGRIIYDNTPYALYRRHQNTVTSNNFGFFGKMKWRVEKFIKGDGLVQYHSIIADIKNVFFDQLCDRDRFLVDIFGTKKGVLSRIKKILYPGRLRSRFADELGLRLLFFLGKL